MESEDLVITEFISNGSVLGALQIVTVDQKEKKVQLVTENVDKFNAAIKSIGNLPCSILSIMGAYRTGKSFILDLILTYLRSKAKIRAKGEGEEKKGELEGEISGFSWRGGMDKCTEGIWIWANPFIFKNKKTGEEHALFLMDTQGAFDSNLSKSESATIFGLTAAISSTLIYNVNKQIQEDTVDNLQFFLECAATAVRKLQTNEAEGEGEDKSAKYFQDLLFLVRDWVNFEDDWTMEEKITQMNEHLKHHTESDEDVGGKIKMFDHVNAWMLPHPGMLVTKPGWKGDLSDVSIEFKKMLVEMLNRLIVPIKQLLLNKQLTCKLLIPVLKSFVEAFASLSLPSSDSLAVAMARSSHLVTKEQKLKLYKDTVLSKIDNHSNGGLSDLELSKLISTTQSEINQQFYDETLFGPEIERTNIKQQFNEDLLVVTDYLKEKNKLKSEKVLVQFAGLLVMIILLFLIDKISDFTCDWWSNTCVRMSSALFFTYSIAIAVLISALIGIWKEKGQSTALIAMIELCKKTVVIIADSYEDIYKAVKNKNYQEISHLVRGLFVEIRNGVQPVTQGVKGWVAGRLQMGQRPATAPATAISRE
jgi:atlastin